MSLDFFLFAIYYEGVNVLILLMFRGNYMNKNTILFLIFGNLLFFSPNMHCSKVTVNGIEIENSKELTQKSIAIVGTGLLAWAGSLITVPAAICIPIAYMAKNDRFIKASVHTTAVFGTLTVASYVATLKLASDIANEAFKLAAKEVEKK